MVILGVALALLLTLVTAQGETSVEVEIASAKEELRALKKAVKEARRLDPKKVCEKPQAEAETLVRRLREGETIRERWRERLPTAASDERLGKEASGLASQCRALRPRLDNSLALCSYGRAMLAAEAAKGLAAKREAVGAKPDAASLGRTFENAPALDEAAVAGEPSWTPALAAGAAPPSASAPQAGAPAPADEPFEALADGVVFRPTESARELEAAKPVFDQALRHLYGIPEGRAVLRDLQRMRAEMAQYHRAQLPEYRKRLDELRREEERASAQRRDQAKESRELFENMVRTLERNPKPLVLVAVTKLDELKWGEAATGSIQIVSDGAGGKTSAVRAGVSEELLGDGNPSRAVDKVMVHELRHLADETVFREHCRSRVRWLLTEDRAYLSEARAIMEQREGMRSEPASRAVEDMRRSTVGSLLANAAADRVNRIASPHYLWHVSPADLDDPETALRSRLTTAFAQLKARGRRSEAAKAAFDPSKALAGALAELERKPRSGTDPLDAFFSLAEKTDAARDWADNVAAARDALRSGNSSGWAEQLKTLESEYWSQLNDFLIRHGGKR